MSSDVVIPRAGGRVMDDWATGHLIDWAAGKGAADRTRDVLRKEIRDMASELAGPEPAPVERALAEAAVAWFALRLHESQFAGVSTGRDSLIRSGQK